MSKEEFLRTLEHRTGLDDPTAEDLLRLAGASGRSVSGLVADVLLSA